MSGPGGAEPRGLPAELKPLFWDCAFRELRWESYQDFIIGRVLAEGDWEAVKWVLERAGRDGVRAWILRRRGRGLEPRQLRFWEQVLGLPHRAVSEWLEDQAALPWGSRTRR